MDVNDMIKDEDLVMQKGPSHSNGLNHAYYATGQNIQQLVGNMVPIFRPKRLSARELNLLKRKAKINAKDQTKGSSEDDEFEGLQFQNSNRGAPIVSVVNKSFNAGEESCDDNGRWPFCEFAEQLIHDIFDPIWEIRHGATMALREILTRQGSCAGVLMPNTQFNTSWLDSEDINDPDLPERESEIDLNNHLTVDEQAPALKRIKIETNYSLSTDNFFSPDVTNVREDFEVNKGAQLDYKPEIDSGIQKTLLDVGISSNMTVSADIPKKLKLKRLMKLTRHSWIKNWEFLQDCAIRFLCVLSLDRFGDFVSDQVVAPVRETCAQALGAVLKYMHPSLVHKTLNVLVQMQCRQEWEVRHGCLLGVKYLVAVRKDMLRDLLVHLLPACKAGLEDPDDDVRAVAAEALIPSAAELVSLKDSTLNSIVMLLWDILLDLDDLSPSTNSVMSLLAEIYSRPEMVQKMLGNASSIGKQEFDLNNESCEATEYEVNPYILSTLTPRLWPFMRHNITSVRHSAICTLERLLEVCYGSHSFPAASVHWNSSIFGDTLRIVFQNLLLESDEQILQCSMRVWRLLVKCPTQDLESAAQTFFNSWVQLATTPVGSTLDVSKMFFPAILPRKSHFKAAAKMKVTKLENDWGRSNVINFAKEISPSIKNDDISNSFLKIVVGVDSEKSVTRTRADTATALGIFASKLSEATLQVVIDPLRIDLTSSSGFQRKVASLILIAWFKELKIDETSERLFRIIKIVEPLRECLLELLACTDPTFPTKDSSLPYAELSRTYNKMRIEASLLFQMADSSDMLKSIISNADATLNTLSVNDAIDLASKISLPTDVIDDLERIESSKRQLLNTSGYLKCLQTNLHVTVSALVAAAVIWISELPPRLNPIILPLMAAVKREKEEILQDKVSEALAELVHNCIGRKPSPNDKLIKNLCSLTCMDPSETPQAIVVTSAEVIEERDLLSCGISTNNQKKVQVPSNSEDKSKHEGFISRRGSELALKHLCQKFGPSLFEKLPKLWECLTEILQPINIEAQSPAIDAQMMLTMNNCKDPQSLINNIQVLHSIASMVDEILKPKILSLLPCIFYCVRHNHVAVRLAASKCITSMAKSMMIIVMGSVIEKVIPLLGDSECVNSRQGAGMLLSLLVQSLGVELVPYAPLLVVPLLRCMSDSDHTVRQSVTRSFAALVPLLPLSRGVHPPAAEANYCLSRNSEDVQFLEQLLDNSHIDDYKLPINLKVELRRYQQEGINWLSFLSRFKLHGILCDDMGLGKTLQASAIVASHISERRLCSSSKDMPSLIICPSTLVGHWAYEIEKYIDDSIMIILQYCGSVQERLSLRKNFKNYNVIITSYDVVRKDIDYLMNISWNYCILDEGHMIKNSKSKITAAIKQLKAEHRLILSGTPIQNNVLELWSLFDFLMPGFLGSEKQFQATYGKPLLAARDSKCSAKDAESGVLALEALHKQVMPFLLRRTKDEVLSDLPEKIIQDRYCDLSPLQLKLYEQFSGSDAKKEVTDLVKVNEIPNVIETATPVKATSHVFQALQYLLKLCSHPLLVIGEKPSDSFMHCLTEVIPCSSNISIELHEIRHSPKLVALQEILEECGIGMDGSSPVDAGVVGQHRVLIFTQHRAFLDIIERDLFQTRLKSVTYLRLDGSVEPGRRFEIVKSFNSDPTIDVFLLTTHVGGLGLNLTSADTIVFMEHDWNPMKDLQAMDRAHRLGQRKVVNVHRIIMRGTLEEKVMNLQRFKLSISDAVINADNASLKTMNTDQLLDLFTPVQISRKGPIVSSGSDECLPEDATKSLPGGKGLKAMLNGLEELWDQSQYTEEYNLNQFLAKLNG